MYKKCAKKYLQPAKGWTIRLTTTMAPLAKVSKQNFEFFAIKVVGQTIYACSTTKMESCSQMEL